MKKSLVILSLLIAGVGIWGFSYTDTNPEDERLLLTLMSKILNENHYAELEFNDEFSNRVYDLYVQRMDYNKMYFLKKDIKSFEAKLKILEDKIQRVRDHRIEKED